MIEDWIRKPKVIDDFRGKYFFLSNFYQQPVCYKGYWYKTSEHAFQAQKATNEKDRQYISDARNPRFAKKRGHEIKSRANWDAIKQKEMAWILLCKFQNQQLREKLLATSNTLLIEGNWWGDKYWGMVKDNNGFWQGDNFLGKLLMKVRDELK